MRMEPIIRTVMERRRVMMFINSVWRVMPRHLGSGLNCMVLFGFVL